LKQKNRQASRASDKIGVRFEYSTANHGIY
jgi:hypothetical protein